MWPARRVFAAAAALVFVVTGCTETESEPSAQPSFDSWGGWRGINATPTGRYRTEIIDGVWWLITPDGHGFFSAGVDHLRPEGDFSPPINASPYADAVAAIYGSDAAWAAATRERLRDWGFNTIGAFSRPELFPQTIAYTVTLTLSTHAPEVPGVPPALVSRITRDYFEPAFAAGVADEVAARIPACASDPWCLGVFPDNELALGQSLAQVLPYVDAYLLLPAGTPGKVALQDFLDDRYSSDISAFNAVWETSLQRFTDLQQVSVLTPDLVSPPNRPNDTPAQRADRRAFDAFVAERYHRVVHDAIRAANPAVLILGSRLLILSTRPEVVAAIATWVDVLTVNYYEIAAEILAIAPDYPEDYGIPFDRMFDDLATMYRLAGKPILIGEFSYRAADSGHPNTLPPFFPTLATQTERTQAAGTYMRHVIASPFVVGAHWFQYMDQPFTGRFDGENQNFGLVQIDDTPWPALTDRFRLVNTSAASRRTLIPGDGDDRANDCLVEWGSTAASSDATTAQFVCHDGDPECDTDLIDGQCTIEIAPCAAIDDTRLRACTPATIDTVDVAQLSGDDDPALQTDLLASFATLQAAADPRPGACGPSVAVVLTLGDGAEQRRSVRVTAHAGARSDSDTITLACQQP